MRALVCNEFGPPEALTVEEREDPRPGAGDVLVDVKAAALNFPDVLIVRGEYQVRTPPPFVPGSEVAADRIVDDIDALAAGQFAHGFPQGRL